MKCQNTARNLAVFFAIELKNSPIELESGCLYSMKIKEQTRKLDAGCTWVRQGEADVVWIWFSKSIILRLVANVWLAYETGSKLLG